MSTMNTAPMVNEKSKKILERKKNKNQDEEEVSKTSKENHSATRDTTH
jgi:hypothetical protein